MGEKRHRPLYLVLLLVLLAGATLYLIWRHPSPSAPPPGPELAPEEARLARGQALYSAYCLACHGERGEGDGPAARYVYPRPRNFGEGKFRIVSTANSYPSDDDLMQVITHGMPGSAMLPFAHLSEDDRNALVAQVRRLARGSVEGWLTRHGAEKGAEVDPEEIAERVERLTHVGEPLEVPALPQSSAESIARGADLYRQTCTGCHGLTGKGDGTQDQRNWDGTPTQPRDFTRGIFKSGRDPRQLYARIRRGMPGSPMPGADHLKPDQVGDLINFILSLSDPASQERVEHRRRLVTARRAPNGLPAEIADAAWEGAESVPVVVSPLWWRNYADPALRVAALHDGQSLALRLSWADATKDDQAVRPQDFEDMAAVQLYKGDAEPFLGMGGADKALDVWLWRAGWPGKPGQVADVNTAYPNMAVDSYPDVQPDGSPPRGFVAADAAGNQLADQSHSLSAGNLQAKGFGTLTMRPRTSQAVTSNASWKDGHWTVVLRRPLAVPPGDGVRLVPGDRVSVAFALWDGAAGDRNGLKMVSVWQDLRLEE
jgi:mono/diheme cytochrome c family protein